MAVQLGDREIGVENNLCVRHQLGLGTFSAIRGKVGAGKETGNQFRVDRERELPPAATAIARSVMLVTINRYHNLIEA